MASRSFSRALRTGLVRQSVAPAIQRRTFIAAVIAARADVSGVTRASKLGPTQQIRGVKTIDFAGHKEQVFGMFTVLIGRWDPANYRMQSAPTGRGRGYSYVIPSV
jgi:ketol-acid reductoisomerase